MTDEEHTDPGERAVERLARALGWPADRKRFTEEERRAFWAEQDRVDEELARRYGPPDAA